jgi:hypothetical protein
VLDIELIDGYQPEVGDAFTLISAAGGVHGAFASQALPGLPVFWSWQLVYGANDLKANVVTSRPWHNSRKGLDVTGDGFIVAADPLAVINYINGFGAGALPAGRAYEAPFVDVNGDNSVSPSDALDVINAINAGEGEGEGSRVSGVGSRGTEAFEEVLELLAMEAARRARRR